MGSASAASAVAAGGPLGTRTRGSPARCPAESSCFGVLLATAVASRITVPSRLKTPPPVFPALLPTTVLLVSVSEGATESNVNSLAMPPSLFPRAVPADCAAGDGGRGAELVGEAPPRGRRHYRVTLVPVMVSCP